MRHLDLFSGIGGFALAAQRVWGSQHEILSFCEIDPYCRKVLKKHWPNAPIHEDVRFLKGAEFEAIDLLTGGFPCQDISTVGKQAGINGKRSGLWGELHRLISEVQPRYAVVENVTNLLQGQRGKWFGRILGDLAEIGYDAEWHCIPASRFGAPHIRDRVWIIAYPNSTQNRCGSFSSVFSFHTLPRRDSSTEWRGPMPSISRMGDGIPYRLDRLGALGNAIVPRVAEVIFQAIKAIESDGRFCLTTACSGTPKSAASADAER